MGVAVGTVVQFIHFHFVGALGTGVNLGALALAHDVFGVPVYPSLVISFTAAVIFNFVCIKKWTFKDDRWAIGLTLRQLFKFYSIAVTGLVLNIGVFYLLYDVADIGVYISQTLAIIAVAPVHFFLNRKHTFHIQPEGDGSSV